MNKRIREFEKQCWSHTINGVLIDGHLHFDVDKFAGLIVQECVDVLNKRFMGDLNREDMEVRRCIEDLKKHFGVKE